jgi:ERF superfamily
MSTLAERAATLAGSPPPQQFPAAPAYAPDPELAEAPRTYAKPEQIPVHEAWNRVMQDVTYISKSRQVTTGPAKYAFRGIEDVVQAFGAAQRRHGIIVGPTKVVPSYTTSSSKNGTAMRECTVVVTWTVIGPMGDTMPVQFESAGEASDHSDKSTTKAQSIAERTLLVILGMVPTNDPEPELESAEMVRGDAAVTPRGYLAEITNPMTPKERFRQIYNELGQHRLTDTLVEHGGEQVPLGKLFLRTAEARWPKAPQQPAAPAPPEPPAMPDHTDHLPGIFDEHCAACFASAEIDRRAAS